jgi:hypothetical protein
MATMEEFWKYVSDNIGQVNLLELATAVAVPRSNGLDGLTLSLSKIIYLKMSRLLNEITPGVAFTLQRTSFVLDDSIQHELLTSKINKTFGVVNSEQYKRVFVRNFFVLSIKHAYDFPKLEEIYQTGLAYKLPDDWLVIKHLPAVKVGWPGDMELDSMLPVADPWLFQVFEGQIKFICDIIPENYTALIRTIYKAARHYLGDYLLLKNNVIDYNIYKTDSLVFDAAQAVQEGRSFFTIREACEYIRDGHGDLKCQFCKLPEYHVRLDNGLCSYCRNCMMRLIN